MEFHLLVVAIGSVVHTDCSMLVALLIVLSILLVEQRCTVARVVNSIDYYLLHVDLEHHVKSVNHGGYFSVNVGQTLRGIPLASLH